MDVSESSRPFLLRASRCEDVNVCGRQEAETVLACIREQLIQRAVTQPPLRLKVVQDGRRVDAVVDFSHRPAQNIRRLRLYPSSVPANHLKTPEKRSRTGLQRRVSPLAAAGEIEFTLAERTDGVLNDAETSSGGGMATHGMESLESMKKALDAERAAVVRYHAVCRVGGGLLAALAAFPLLLSGPKLRAVRVYLGPRLIILI